MKELSAMEIWHRYEKGVDYLNRIDLANKTQRCHRFFSGDQWYGIKSGGEELPSLNFIKGLVRYKTTSVSQNTVAAIFSPMEGDSKKELQACDVLGRYFKKNWEHGKLDTLCRNLIREAAIQGDGYLYFGSGADILGAQNIDNVNIFLSDEQNSNLQEQKYIIIRERRFVEDVIKEAEENAIHKDNIALITKDSDTFSQLGDKVEVDLAEKGKCISLLYMEKDEEGYVHITRCVRGVIYQKDTVIKCSTLGQSLSRGLKSYPIVNFLWEEKKGSARGFGEVEFLIPNQIEINKTIARRSIAVKQTAFPLLAYAANLINNPEDLELIGGKIAVNNGNAQAIEQIISYLRPANISPDAKNLSDELLMLSRELSGAGDSAIGAVDPTKASGTAIIAVRDQAQLPLNEQVSRYSQLVEDLARLFIDMWIAYNPKGITLSTEGAKEYISPEVMEKLKVDIRIDIMKANAFSLYATEQTLLDFLNKGFIQFEEFVAALPNGGAVPKNTLMDILEKRGLENSLPKDEGSGGDNRNELISSLMAEKEKIMGAFK